MGELSLSILVPNLAQILTRDNYYQNGVFFPVARTQTFIKFFLEEQEDSEEVFLFRRSSNRRSFEADMFCVEFYYNFHRSVLALLHAFDDFVAPVPPKPLRSKAVLTTEYNFGISFPHHH